jgi:hypothetical protein
LIFFIQDNLIFAHLEELKIDPYRPRPKADIVSVRGDDYPMAARSEVIVTADEPIDEFAALEEDDESTAQELHALIERERGEFISLEEYRARRGI